LQGQDLVVY